MNKKILLQSLTAIVFLAVITVASPFAFAANNWEPPYGLRPPENNVFAPINIGRDFQAKSGALQVEALRVQLLTYMGWENKTAPTSFPANVNPGLAVEKDIVANKFCNFRGDCLDFDQLSRDGRVIPNGAVMAFNLSQCPTEAGWYPLDGTDSSLPNLAGRNIIGAGAGYTLASPPGGNKQVTLQKAHIPNFSLDTTIPKSQNTRAENGSDGKVLYGPGSGRTGTFYSSNGIGSQAPVNIMDPYVVLTYCVKK